MTAGKDDLTKGTFLGRKDGYSKTDGKYRQEELGFSDGVRIFGRVASTKLSSQPVDLFTEYLDGLRVRTKGGKEMSGWQAYRACFKKPGTDPEDCQASTFTQEMYDDDWIADSAISLLRRSPGDKPWMLQINFSGPHNPFMVTAAMSDSVAGRIWPNPADNPDNEVSPGGTCPLGAGPDLGDDLARCKYAAGIENLDGLLARILAEVEAQGQTDNTVVCISSDHGDELGDHRGRAKSRPWAGSVRVPLICAGPGIAQGRVFAGPVDMSDLAATFLDAAGAPLLDGMTSRSLLPLMSVTPPDIDAYRSHINGALGTWVYIVQSWPDPTSDVELEQLASLKLICAKKNSWALKVGPSTMPSGNSAGYVVMLVHVEADPFDMNDLSTRSEYRSVMQAMLPLLPEPYDQECAADFNR